MPKPRHASSYTFTPEAKDLLEKLSDTMGIPRSKVIEVALRLLARRELKPPPPPIQQGR